MLNDALFIAIPRILRVPYYEEIGCKKINVFNYRFISDSMEDAYTLYTHMLCSNMLRIWLTTIMVWVISFKVSALLIVFVWQKDNYTNFHSLNTYLMVIEIVVSFGLIVICQLSKPVFWKFFLKSPLSKESSDDFSNKLPLDVYLDEMCQGFNHHDLVKFLRRIMSTAITLLIIKSVLHLALNNDVRKSLHAPGSGPNVGSFADWGLAVLLYVSLAPMPVFCTKGLLLYGFWTCLSEFLTMSVPGYMRAIRTFLMTIFLIFACLSTSLKDRATFFSFVRSEHQTLFLASETNKLEIAKESQREFFFKVVHELKTPLNGLIHAAGFLRYELEEAAKRNDSGGNETHAGVPFERNVLFNTKKAFLSNHDSTSVAQHNNNLITSSPSSTSLNIPTSKSILPTDLDTQTTIHHIPSNLPQHSQVQINPPHGLPSAGVVSLTTTEYQDIQLHLDTLESSARFMELLACNLLDMAAVKNKSLRKFNGMQKPTYKELARSVSPKMDREKKSNEENEEQPEDDRKVNNTTPEKKHNPISNVCDDENIFNSSIFSSKPSLDSQRDSKNPFSYIISKKQTYCIPELDNLSTKTRAISLNNQMRRESDSSYSDSDKNVEYSPTLVEGGDSEVIKTDDLTGHSRSFRLHNKDYLDPSGNLLIALSPGLKEQGMNFTFGDDVVQPKIPLTTKAPTKDIKLISSKHHNNNNNNNENTNKKRWKNSNVVLKTNINSPSSSPLLDSPSFSSSSSSSGTSAESDEYDDGAKKDPENFLIMHALGYRDEFVDISSLLSTSLSISEPTARLKNISMTASIGIAPMRPLSASNECHVGEIPYTIPWSQYKSYFQPRRSDVHSENPTDKNEKKNISELFSRGRDEFGSILSLIIKPTDPSYTYYLPELPFCDSKALPNYQRPLRDLPDGSKRFEPRWKNLSELLDMDSHKDAKTASSQIYPPICPDIPDKLHFIMDRVRFLQIFNNVISNAVKYTPSSGSVDVSLILTPLEVVPPLEKPLSQQSESNQIVETNKNTEQTSAKNRNVEDKETSSQLDCNAIHSSPASSYSCSHLNLSGTRKINSKIRVQRHESQTSIEFASSISSASSQSRENKESFAANLHSELEKKSPHEVPTLSNPVTPEIIEEGENEDFKRKSTSFSGICDDKTVNRGSVSPCLSKDCSSIHNANVGNQKRKRYRHSVIPSSCENQTEAAKISSAEFPKFGRHVFVLKHRSSPRKMSRLQDPSKQLEAIVDAYGGCRIPRVLLKSSSSISPDTVANLVMNIAESQAQMYNRTDDSLICIADKLSSQFGISTQHQRYKSLQSNQLSSGSTVSSAKSIMNTMHMSDKIAAPLWGERIPSSVHGFQAPHPFSPALHNDRLSLFRRYYFSKARRRLESNVLNTPGCLEWFSTCRLEVWRLDMFIRDTGRGVSPEALSRLFENYSQAEETDAAIGTGLGLAITRSSLSAINGGCRLSSEGRGMGSCFTLWLPIVRIVDGGSMTMGSSDRLPTIKRRWSSLGGGSILKDMDSFTDRELLAACAGDAEPSHHLQDTTGNRKTGQSKANAHFLNLNFDKHFSFNNHNFNNINTFQHTTPSEETTINENKHGHYYLNPKMNNFTSGNLLAPSPPPSAAGSSLTMVPNQHEIQSKTSLSSIILPEIDSVVGMDRACPQFTFDKESNFPVHSISVPNIRVSINNVQKESNNIHMHGNLIPSLNTTQQSEDQTYHATNFDLLSTSSLNYPKSTTTETTVKPCESKNTIPPLISTASITPLQRPLTSEAYSTVAGSAASQSRSSSPSFLHSSPFSDRAFSPSAGIIVLCIDDDLINRIVLHKLFSSFFSACGLSIQTDLFLSPSAEDALIFLERLEATNWLYRTVEDPDVNQNVLKGIFIITDLSMPGGANGTVFGKWREDLRERLKTTITDSNAKVLFPFIYLLLSSAYGSKRDVKRSICRRDLQSEKDLEEFDYFLSKPISTAKLRPLWDIFLMNVRNAELLSRDNNK